MMSEGAELLDHLLEAVGAVACSAQSPNHRAAAHKAKGEALQILQAAPIAPLNSLLSSLSSTLESRRLAYMRCQDLPKPSIAETNKKQAGA